MWTVTHAMWKGSEVSAMVEMHEPGDVVWTISDNGEVQAYRVQRDGSLTLMTSMQAAEYLSQA